ncbi:muscle-specific protein [Anaeramoeba flamelloides]|uniref:Muscle-specific protein n=1 Tax=Anaeramoeba flamelloides TaxID=1746091 RepID=A0AAV7ZZT8_9EUKA|nr:muscle-specific protein [Anaeramoeba flamelloides]
MTKFVTTWLSHVLNKKVKSKTILDLTVNLCNAMNLLYPNAIPNITDDPLENSKNFFEGYTKLGFKATNKFNANNLAKGRLVGLREILESLTRTKQHKWTRKLNFKVEKQQTDHNTQGIVANISRFFVKGFTTFEVTFKSNQYEYQPGTIQLTENHFLLSDYYNCESRHKYQSLTINRLLQDRSNQKILKLYLPIKTKGLNTKPNKFLSKNSQYADKNKKKIKKIEYYSQEESLFFEEEEEEEELISLIICFKRQTE